mmetsp:Transcript_42630/g.99978  ORF Transcript_42630/g.99978 Transcript_42630/m.99978 type:complete len:90 (-) Transcript_42630:595-864(-)
MQTMHQAASLDSNNLFTLDKRQQMEYRNTLITHLFPELCFLKHICLTSKLGSRQTKLLIPSTIVKKNPVAIRNSIPPSNLPISIKNPSW